MGQQVRVWFARTNAAALLSQPQLRKGIRQAFFSSRLPVCGATPGRSVLCFAAPLTAGLESNTECFDFTLPGAFFDPDAIYCALNGAMPGGVQVFAVTPVRHSATEIAAVRYLIRFRAGARGCAAAELLLQQAGAVQGMRAPVCKDTISYQWLFQNTRARKACLDITIPRGHSGAFDPRKLFAVPGGGKTPVNLFSVCRTQFLLPDGMVFE